MNKQVISKEVLKERIIEIGIQGKDDRSIQHKEPFLNAFSHLIDCWVDEVTYINYLCKTQFMIQYSI